jgi:hypothetical protein
VILRPALRVVQSGIGGCTVRVGVRLGPFYVSGRTRRRRRRRSSRSAPARRGWQGRGEATTPDGRRVKFRCGHQHRSYDAALACVASRQRQIEQGKNLHLVTFAQETAASRQLAAERAAQEAARRQELAAQRQEAARQRAEQRAAARQVRAEQAAAIKQARAGRPSLGWPKWALAGAAAAFVLGLVLVQPARSNPHSGVAVVGALVIIAAVFAGLVSAPVAVWRWIATRRARATSGGERSSAA